MDANLIRLAWSAVDATPLPRQQNLSLGDRIGAVLNQLDSQCILSPGDRQQIQQYLTSRQHLLRELYR